MPPERLIARLKETMNLMHGAFFDSIQRRVAYERMRGSDIYADYVDLSRNLRAFDPARLGSPEERIAFWVNLYNVIIIHGVIDLDVHDSVREVRNFFRRIRYDIGGLDFTPDDIEHGILRANRKPPWSLFRKFSQNDPRLGLALQKVDPRIHFALVCASSSCPPIGVYTPEDLDHELDVAAHTFINAGDFGHSTEQVLRYLAGYFYDEEDKNWLLEKAAGIAVRYANYDWRLNR